MPVAFVKASSVGIEPASSSRSMYSGQLDQLTTFSVSDRSCAAARALAGAEAPAPGVAVPSVPQAASALPRATAPAPRKKVRRVSVPRSSGTERGGMRSMCGLPEGRVGRAQVGAVRSANTVRCQGLRGTAVRSCMTCLSTVYSATEYADMSLP